MATVGVKGLTQHCEDDTPIYRSLGRVAPGFRQYCTTGYNYWFKNSCSGFVGAESGRGRDCRHISLP